MRLTKTGKADNTYFYVIEDYRTPEGIKKTRTVESLGCAKVIREKYQVADALQWCKDYIESKNQELREAKRQNSRYMTIKLQENLPKESGSCIFNAGYLILDSIYHSFGIANICAEIMKEHPHITGFDLNNVLRAVLFGRILFPSSKLVLSDKHQRRFLEKFNVEVQHIYRAMDLLNSSNTIIQDRLYYYSSKNVRRNVSHIYYDCTNFYSETEMEDCDKEGRTTEWKQEHTLRKYGRSKENRPKPIVQMGLLMDGDGMPLGFCINPGNTSEQITLIPLEEKIFKNFREADVVVCTDAGLSSEENRRYNNKDADDSLVQFGLSGQRRFICTQSIKKLGKNLKEWALEDTGWSYFHFDTTTHRYRKVTDACLSKLYENEDLFHRHYNTLFFKERTTAEHNLDSRLIVTFSLKYREYLRSLRGHKSYFEDKGNQFTRTASVNENKAAEDEKYDGFYAQTTNIFKDELPLQKIISISSRRREIEECFRIMKTDLSARPFYHRKDSRIVAHFQICFMALLLLRGVERKIADHLKDTQTYPDAKYTMDEILYALRNMNMFAVSGGRGYIPDYEDTEMITDLLNIFDLKEFGSQVVMSDTLKKIIKKIKVSPAMYREE